MAFLSTKEPRAGNFSKRFLEHGLFVGGKSDMGIEVSLTRFLNAMTKYHHFIQ